MKMCSPKLTRNPQWNHEKWGFATRRDLEAEEGLAKKDLISALPSLPITVFNIYN